MKVNIMFYLHNYNIICKNQILLINIMFNKTVTQICYNIFIAILDSTFNKYN